ncbi:hypothetical protein Tco_1507747 [Tanacetum coccineum]
MPCSCDRRGMWDRRENVIASLVVKCILIFIMAKGEIDNLTMEQYLALTRGNQPLRDGWTDFLQEPSIPRISLRKPLSKGTVHHQRLPSSLKKSATSSRKETKHYTKLGNGIMTFYINAPPMTSITIRRPLPGMTPVQALTAIQTMADHSQKWHDGTSSRNIESSSSLEGITTIVNKLENLGRDMKKLKENVHAIQVGCQICEGTHLDKDCLFYEEIKSMKKLNIESLADPSQSKTEMTVDLIKEDMTTPHQEKEDPA